MKDSIKIEVIDREGVSSTIETKVDPENNLMEVCKENDFPIRGNCGGMALCCTCHCYIHSDHSLKGKEEIEEALLADSFYYKDNSRLVCQIPITKDIDGLKIELAPDN